MRLNLLWLSCAAFLFAAPLPCSPAAELRGRVIDADTRQAIAARIYARSVGGKWLHVESIGGKAVPYAKTRGEGAVEVHTSISAHPFRLEAAAGKVEIVVERGKEYLSHRQLVALTDKGGEIEIRLKRWIDMNQLGWYSGETHVHRSVSELPTAMLAEDMNVGLPLTYWVTRSHTPPTQGDRNEGEQVQPKLIRLDATHVIYPMNTEYEIFTVKGRRHTLGAIFAINHRAPLKLVAPPVSPIADAVRAQGGLLELDKHNWPWSMMLPPIMKVDLYELTNNHIWRTNFLYRDFGEPPADYMRAEADPKGGVTERGWIQYTLENYYALLNCGFRMKPTAGCASGVHPVPLGFGRVYVHLPGGFSYQDWMKGLGAGRSFVTTGPMMDIRFDGGSADKSRQAKSGDTVKIRGWIESPHPLTSIEILDAGQVAHQITPQPARTERGAFRAPVEYDAPIGSTTWLAVRCYSQTPAGRQRFAHSAPYHVSVSGSQLTPRPEQAEFLARRVREQLERSREVLTEQELAEYSKALAFYEQFLP